MILICQLLKSIKFLFIQLEKVVVWTYYLLSGHWVTLEYFKINFISLQPSEFQRSKKIDTFKDLNVR